MLAATPHKPSNVALFARFAKEPLDDQLDAPLLLADDARRAILGPLPNAPEFHKYTLRALGKAEALALGGTGGAHAKMAKKCERVLEAGWPAAVVVESDASSSEDESDEDEGRAGSLATGGDKATHKPITSTLQSGPVASRDSKLDIASRMPTPEPSDEEDSDGENAEPAVVLSKTKLASKPKLFAPPAPQFTPEQEPLLYVRASGGVLSRTRTLLEARTLAPQLAVRAGVFACSTFTVTPAVSSKDGAAAAEGNGDGKRVARSLSRSARAGLARSLERARATLARSLSRKRAGDRASMPPLDAAQAEELKSLLDRRAGRRGSVMTAPVTAIDDDEEPAAPRAPGPLVTVAPRTDTAMTEMELYWHVAVHRTAPLPPDPDAYPLWLPEDVQARTFAPTQTDGAPHARLLLVGDPNLRFFFLFRLPRDDAKARKWQFRPARAAAAAAGDPLGAPPGALVAWAKAVGRQSSMDALNGPSALALAVAAGVDARLVVAALVAAMA